MTKCVIRDIFVSSAVVGVAQRWSTACLLVTFNDKAPGGGTTHPSLVHCVEQLREGWVWEESCSGWAFPHGESCLNSETLQGNCVFFSSLKLLTEWQATVITRQGIRICHVFCLFSPLCEEVGRGVNQIKADNPDELCHILQLHSFCHCSYELMHVSVFLELGENQGLQSPEGQRVTCSKGCIWKLQGKCPKIINLGTPQAAVDQQWIHIIEFQANHSSPRVKLWINIRQNTPSGEPCLM